MGGRRILSCACTALPREGSEAAGRVVVFDDILLAQSAVDRFKNSAFDLVMEGESYRPCLKPRVDPDDPPPKSPSPKPLRHPRARARRR